MNKRKFRKLVPEGTTFSKRVFKTAKYMVNNEMGPMDNLPEEQKDAFVHFIAANMKVGERLARKSTLIQGAIIGTVLTVGYFKVREIIKKEDQKIEE